MFDPWSYILIFASILVISLVFIVILVLSKIRYPLRYNQTILYVVAAFFQETFPKSKLPKEGFKVKDHIINNVWMFILYYKLVLIWYIYSMVITNMYMSVLIKQLTHTHYVGSVESLEDVLDQNLIPLMFQRSSSIDPWKQSTDQTLR